MKKHHLPLFLVIMLFGLGALQWPVKEVLLTATFGEPRTDHFHNGIDLGKGDQAVRPVAKGELIYYLDKARHPLYRVFGNGNLVVLQHKDGSRSYYYHLKTGSVRSDKPVLEPGDVFALSGNTGRSLGAHLHLGYSTGKGLLNPLSRLPALPDRNKPVIASILFRLGDRMITLKQKNRFTGIDRFILLARVYDNYEAIERLAVLGIYRIRFSIDGRPVKDYRFDRFSNKNGRLVLGDTGGFNAVYHKATYYVGGEYRNIVGLHRIKVEAWDFAGNRAEKQVEVQLH